MNPTTCLAIGMSRKTVIIRANWNSNTTARNSFGRPVDVEFNNTISPHLLIKQQFDGRIFQIGYQMRGSHRPHFIAAVFELDDDRPMTACV